MGEADCVGLSQRSKKRPRYEIKVLKCLLPSAFPLLLSYFFLSLTLQLKHILSWLLGISFCIIHIPSIPHVQNSGVRMRISAWEKDGDAYF